MIRNNFIDYATKTADTPNAPKKRAQRAFSVSGRFRQLLSDLIKYIKYMHNSNRQLHQVTLSGEALLEPKYYVMGFVPADVVRLKRNVWFSKLDSEQIDSVERFLEGSGFFPENLRVPT